MVKLRQFDGNIVGGTIIDTKKSGNRWELRILFLYESLNWQMGKTFLVKIHNLELNLIELRKYSEKLILLYIPSPVMLLFKFTKSQIVVIFPQLVAQAQWWLWKQKSHNMKQFWQVHLAIWINWFSIYLPKI